DRPHRELGAGLLEVADPRRLTRRVRQPRSRSGTASAAACAISPSISLVTPLTAIAPTITPSTVIGTAPSYGAIPGKATRPRRPSSTAFSNVFDGDLNAAEL